MHFAVYLLFPETFSNRRLQDSKIVQLYQSRSSKRLRVCITDIKRYIEAGIRNLLGKTLLRV